MKTSDLIFLTFLANMKDLANALGGNINNAIFDLLLKKLGIDKIIMEGPCDLPESPEGKTHSSR